MQTTGDGPKDFANLLHAPAGASHIWGAAVNECLRQNE
jgi:hypothetical protein